MLDYVSQAVERVRVRVGTEEVLEDIRRHRVVAAAALTRRAIGYKLTCVFVDDGLPCLGEDRL